MRNLKLLKKNCFYINNHILSTCLSNDYEDGLFCLTDESIIFSNGKDLKNIVPDVCYSFLRIQNGMSLYCATDRSVISYDNFNGMELDKLDFDDGIFVNGLSLSPDGSILVVLTSDLHLMILSNELQILTTFYLEQSGFGTAEPLSIGWGKKETQFHGKIGKEARNVTEKVNEQSAFDTHESFIAWKQDGEYFAISWICSSKIQNDSMIGTRLIRVFSKDGELLSTSEPTNVLENGLFWRTKSNYIATTCRNNKGLEVVFFEQNGLRHGGFMLFDQDKCEHKVASSVSFNANDDICAVVIQDVEQSITQVDLFTTDNYHWYKKQTINFESIERITPYWSMDNLHIISQNGTHSTYQWYSEVDRSIVADYTGSNKSFKIPNLVAVIDGDKLLMTPFEYGVVPPPYCAFTINFSNNVSFVSLPRITEIGDDGISCLVQLANNSVQWLKLTRRQVDDNRKSLPTTLKFGTSLSLYYPIIEAVTELKDPVNSVHWINNDSLYCVVGNQLFLYRLVDSIIIQEIIPTGDVVIGKICHNNQLYIQDIYGQVYQMTLDGDLEPMFKLSTFCSEIYCLALKSETDDVIISFSSVLNKLFINGNLQSGSYLSILPIKNHLICTNNNQKLRCINLMENSLNSLIHLMDDKNYKCDFDFDETFRLIEPGTIIITCVLNDSKIILMMPRGNLETIYPRALVLDDLQQLMNMGLYSEAVEKMRRQRVNLNLLYDHNPEMLMNNLEKLIRNNVNNDRLVLFLSELSMEDVTESMYKRFYNLSNREKPLLNGHVHKVNRVCSAVAKLLEHEVTDEYLNLILTAYVKMCPPASDKALQLLRTCKDNGKQKMWDKGLKYLQYLISIDDLYRVALSTYDLSLTLQVAQKTQLDPKEYISFINGLSELPCEHYRRFKINIFLKKPSLALEFIAKVAEIHWDETVELIKSNNLYVKALELFAPRSRPYNDISSLFAEHLINKSSDLKGAGIVYLRTQDTELCKNAANCFMRTLNWKEWIIAAKKSGMDSSEFNIGLTTMSAKLRNIGRFSESMIINELYLNNILSAFHIALEGNLFIDGFRLMSLMTDVTEDCSSTINSVILKTYNNFMSQIEDYTHKFNEDLQRLVEVRTSFIKHYNEMALAGEDEILSDFMSDTSGATSVSSKSSVYSKASNMSTNSSKFQLKKKKVKKQWSDKKGSQKEEVGLLENIYGNIKNVQSLIIDINGLVDILCFTGHVNNANLIIVSVNKLLALHSNSLAIIWDEFIVNPFSELNEDEIQISNHIKVSRGPKHVGRRRYLFDESFLKQAPQMNIFNITNVICDL